jgi:hypothetical protein
MLSSRGNLRAQHLPTSPREFERFPVYQDAKEPSPIQLNPRGWTTWVGER